MTVKIGISGFGRIGRQVYKAIRERYASAIDTLVVGGNLAKVVAWYDNELGYAVRVADLVHYVAARAR